MTVDGVDNTAEEVDEVGKKAEDLINSTADILIEDGITEIYCPWAD